MRLPFNCVASVDGTALSGARYRIIQSWNRCRQLGVDPQKNEATVCFDVGALRVANEELLRAAKPVLERLASAGRYRLYRCAC